MRWLLPHCEVLCWLNHGCELIFYYAYRCILCCLSVFFHLSSTCGSMMSYMFHVEYALGWRKGMEGKKRELQANQTRKEPARGSPAFCGAATRWSASLASCPPRRPRPMTKKKSWVPEFFSHQFGYQLWKTEILEIQIGAGLVGHRARRGSCSHTEAGRVVTRAPDSLHHCCW